jgi:mercuric ion transport protein
MDMPTVDLVYDAECPNISVARTNLMRAFSLAGIQPKWSEYRIGDPNAPERTRGYGSPTVLVDGRDVAGLEPSAEVCCRIYTAATGSIQAPSAEQIAEALSMSAKPS